MKGTLYLLFLISISMCSELENGITAYNNRADGSDGIIAQSKNINRAIRHFERAMKIDALEEEAADYLLRCYYYKGTFVLSDEDARKAEYNKGKALAEEMIAKYPNSAALRFKSMVSLQPQKKVWLT